MTKIEFYRASSCPLCRQVEIMLKKLLTDKGLNYRGVVIEKITDASPESARIGEIYIPTVPTLIIGKKLLSGSDILNEEKLKKFLSEILNL